MKLVPLRKTYENTEVFILPSRVVWLTEHGADNTLVQLDEGQPFSVKGSVLEIVNQIDDALL